MLPGNSDLLNNDLQVSGITQTYLSESARWGKFLSVVGFIFCGVIFITSFFIPSIYSKMSRLNDISSDVMSQAAGTLSIVYIVLAFVLFVPCLFLYRFSIRMKAALTSVSQPDFEASFKNLKSLFKFYGIVTIILLSFYAFLFVIFMIALAVNS